MKKFMKRDDVKKAIDKVKEAAKLLPYLLPAIVLSLSLASSFLVAANPESAGNGARFMGTHSPSPSPSPTPPPVDALYLTIDEPDNTEHANTDSIPFTMDRTVQNTVPYFTSAVSLTTTMNTPVAIILPVLDGESNPITAISVNTPTTKGSTVTIDGSYLFTYTPGFNFTGVETILVKLSDGAISKIYEVTVTVS